MKKLLLQKLFDNRNRETLGGANNFSVSLVIRKI